MASAKLPAMPAANRRGGGASGIGGRSRSSVEPSTRKTGGRPSRWQGNLLGGEKGSRFAHGRLLCFADTSTDYFNRTTTPVTTSAAAHTQSTLNHAVRSRPSPSLRYTIHAASVITARYAAV